MLFQHLLDNGIKSKNTQKNQSVLLLCTCYWQNHTVLMDNNYSNYLGVNYFYGRARSLAVKAK